MSLAGKVFVVTGAGSGIGAAVASRLVASGAAVTIVGRREDALRRLAEDAADQVLAMPIDVTSPGAADDIVVETLRRFGRLDGVVNNAGLARFAGVEDADLDDLRSMLDIHVQAPAALVKAALASLRLHRGSVVNISSVGGVLAMPCRSFYGASKAALNSLTRSWARELAPEVRVNAVLPGPVDTPMYEDLGLSRAETATLRRHLVDDTPMGRFGAAAEVAPWICSLLDDEVSGWITGALLPIDGGRTA